MGTHVNLEATDGFRYFTFEPPITAEVYDNLPMPESAFYGSRGELAEPIDVARDKSGRIKSIGFEVIGIGSVGDYHQQLIGHLNPKN